jgi:beta-glucanase (GH16 family)
VGRRHRLRADWGGFCYTAFVTKAAPKPIVDWAVAVRMRTEDLLLQAITPFGKPIASYPSVSYGFCVTRGLSMPLLSVVVSVSLVACSSFSVAAPESAPPPPPPSPGLVFDDFNGPAETLPNPALWTYDIGPAKDISSGGDLETDTNSTNNIRLDGQGHLIIQALKTSTGYTSARLVTRGKVNMLYGTITARIKFPSGQGIWPAFWTLGSNMDTIGWPQCGEIDIMELVNTGSTYWVSLHGPQGKSDYLDGNGLVTSGPIADLTKDFHDYWVNWHPNSITIGVDASTLAAFTPSSLPPGAQWASNHPMYALLDVAVGGNWPGPPDESTPFPATMIVDWFKYTP